MTASLYVPFNASQFLLSGRDHELGADDLVELLGGDEARVKSRLAEGDALLVGVLGNGGGV